MRPFSAMLLLGLRLEPNGAPREEMIRRADLAAKLFREGKAPRIAVCGGITSGAPKSEAEVLQSLLLERGVPKDSIVLEEKSLDTAENILNARSLLRLAPRDRVLIVTSCYHVKRSLLLCRYLKVRASGIGVELPDSPALRKRLQKERMMRINMRLHHLFPRLRCPAVLAVGFGRPSAPDAPPPPKGAFHSFLMPMRKQKDARAAEK